MTLAIRDHESFTRTRAALHAVAEHVLAALRYHVEERIGLVATDGGFGTPDLADGSSARVSGTELVVVRDGHEHVQLLTTIEAAADACGIEPGAPPVYRPVTPLVPDATLDIDAGAARQLSDWLAFAWARLEELGAAPTLWPEHFDAAVELGDEAAGERGTFGASPGDEQHHEPYLYVTHWAPKPDDPFWDDAAFGGASVALSTLAATADAAAAARSFFEQGQEALRAR